MNINNELKQLIEYRSLASLKKSLEKPIFFSTENFTSIIPSIISGSDGPYLESLFLPTENYLCEIQLAGKIEDFDFVPLKSVKNYRFTLSDLEVENAEKKKIHYQVAKITLIHDVGIDIMSTLSYVGKERQEWLDKVKSVLPISILL